MDFAGEMTRKAGGDKHDVLTAADLPAAGALK
jgi:hypothetical protein